MEPDVGDEDPDAGDEDPDAARDEEPDEATTKEPDDAGDEPKLWRTRLLFLVDLIAFFCCSSRFFCKNLDLFVISIIPSMAQYIQATKQTLIPTRPNTYRLPNTSVCLSPTQPSSACMG